MKSVQSVTTKLAKNVPKLQFEQFHDLICQVTLHVMPSNVEEQNMVLELIFGQTRANWCQKWLKTVTTLSI